MKLKDIRYIFSFSVLLMLVTTNGISGNILHGPPVYKQTSILPHEESIVIYRENDGDIKNTAVIFANNNIVMASLLPDEYVQTKVCMSGIELRVATRGNMTSKGKSEMIKIENEKINYIKIVQAPNKTFYPVVVNEIEGRKALLNISTTSNIINRYIPQMTFNTDSLFAFNSAELLPLARIIMDKLVRDIKICSNKIGSIKIIGHTDRIGNVAFNEKLSKKRANTVADYLIGNGVTASISVHGRGSREPIVTNCKGRLSQKLIQCLQPNRRVVVELLNESTK